MLVHFIHAHIRVRETDIILFIRDTDGTDFAYNDRSHVYMRFVDEISRIVCIRATDLTSFIREADVTSFIRETDVTERIMTDLTYTCNL